jgi:hypothetical protein
MRGNDTEGRGGAPPKPLPDMVTIFEPKEEVIVQMPVSENSRPADIDPSFGEAGLEAVPENQEQPMAPEEPAAEDLGL